MGANNYDAAYLHRLAVLPKFSGRGIGSDVVEWATHKAKSNKKEMLRLDVVSGNLKLRSYYEGLGFVNVGDVDTPSGSTALYQKELR